eukprot:gene5583-3992_t
MSDFQVQNNLLTGPIDPSFFDTPHLEIFLVDENLITDNKMHGTIPVDVGSLTELYNFKIDTNSFSGTLPEGMQHWHKLSEIYLQVTNIGGTLPDWIGNWVNITQFIAYDTQFHGTLPSIITSLKGLEKIYLYQNQFHGTLPSTWRHMEKLLQLLLHDNDFTGSIPPDLCHVQYIRSLQLDNNRLNGTIPHCFNESRYLQTLQFYGNELTGSIPPTITDIPYLEFLEIATNYLTGSIPDGFANISTLIEFSAYNNLLTGPLPVNMDRMPLLDELYLAYNLLSGPVPLPSPFMAKVSLHPLVNTTADFFILNINSNSFTGTVPDSIFAIDNLQSVVLSLNCFSGTLPATLCDSEGLVDLLMDGLHASPRCHYERFLNTKFHVDIFESAWQVHGSIPTCVWQLPNLQVLHLSGNSLQGSITLPTENVLVSFNQTIGWNKHIEITANESVAFGHVQERNGGARDPASPLGLVDASIVAWNLSLLETSLLRKPLNPAQQLRVIVARDFAVLLTFGVLFPPLLVIIALAMVVQIHMIQMLLGRLHAMTPSTASPLTAATRSYGHRLQQWLQKANLSFADFDRGLWQGLAMSVSVAAVFWSLSLFDILADSDGGNNAVHAVWILMVMATAPFWMYALDVAWRRGSQRSWGCPLLLRWPLPQPAQSAGDVGTTASASASATVGDDDGMAVDGDDIEMRSTRGTASTRATLSTVHLRPSEAPSFSARTSTATLPPACVQLPPSL